MSPDGAGRFPGTVALVTGSAGGIGAATALRLGREGARLAVVDLDAERCRDTVDRLASTGAVARGYGCDVVALDAVEELREKVESDLGTVQILVNNAGVLIHAPITELSAQQWQRTLEVNLSSMFHTCRTFVPGMKAVGGGRIVNLSSRAALGNLGQANYSAAKAGVQGFTASLALDVGPFGITVNAVAPGYVATPMTEQMTARRELTRAEHEAAIASRTPLRRVGQPADIAAVIAFFASDDAGYVTGQTLYVNGGAMSSLVSAG